MGPDECLVIAVRLLDQNLQTAHRFFLAMVVILWFFLLDAAEYAAHCNHITKRCAVKALPNLTLSLTFRHRNYIIPITYKMFAFRTLLLKIWNNISVP